MFSIQGDPIQSACVLTISPNLRSLSEEVETRLADTHAVVPNPARPFLTVDTNVDLKRSGVKGILQELGNNLRQRCQYLSGAKFVAGLRRKMLNGVFSNIIGGAEWIHAAVNATAVSRAAAVAVNRASVVNQGKRLECVKIDSDTVA
jgi:hypothetical protein